MTQFKNTNLIICSNNKWLTNAHVTEPEHPLMPKLTSGQQQAPPIYLPVSLQSGHLPTSFLPQLCKHSLSPPPSFLMHHCATIFHSDNTQWHLSEEDLEKYNCYTLYEKRWTDFSICHHSHTGIHSCKSNRNNHNLSQTVVIIIKKIHHQYILVTEVTIVKLSKSACSCHLLAIYNAWLSAVKCRNRNNFIFTFHSMINMLHRLYN